MEDLDTLVLRTAHAWMRAGRQVLLVTVARTWGSSPRPPGSLMALNDLGETVGSVSGGCIEDDLIARIRAGGEGAGGGVEAACAGEAPVVLRYGISADEAHRFGLPCGGTVELVLERLGPHSLVEPLLQACRQRQCTERTLSLRDGRVALRTVQRGQAGDGLPSLSEEALITHLGPRLRLVLIGAGDLSRFMCQMALPLGFEVTVCDPRAEHHAGWELSGVTLSHEMPDDLILRLRPDARTAVVALTHDPKLDDLALMDALRSDAFYVGAIGSRRNSAARRQRLHEHFGLREEELDRLQGPAGLYIGSKTPAEIALSILAEVVAVKNGIHRPAPEPVAQGKALRERSGEAMAGETGGEAGGFSEGASCG